jgi:hypothetical protein
MLMSPKVKVVTLFTLSENIVLRAWFLRNASEPARDRAVPSSGSDLDCALLELGFVEEPSELYDRCDAVVGAILLEAIEHRLPQWASVTPERSLIMARGYRCPAERNVRTVKLAAQALFTVNWGGAPGNTWPEAYKLVWVPMFERFVVTSSADSPEPFGYCDFALGEFGRDIAPLEGAKKIITENWSAQSSGWHQEKWESMFDSGLVSKDMAHQWADIVWPPFFDEDYNNA